MNAPQSWPLRRLGLRVLDLQAQVEFYQGLGLELINETTSTATLGFGAQPVLDLARLGPKGIPRPPRTAGLYHFALLLPSERDLGSFLRHVVDSGITLDGASDHHVSQALYLSDLEGNGIEVYADRPPDTWTGPGGRILMHSRPLDLQRLLEMSSEPLNRFPALSRLGHMHLNVGNLESSGRFYHELGMNTQADLGSARFVSWDGYHHHLGLNTWAGTDIAPAPPNATGLDYFEISRPGLATNELRDPSGITVRALD
ncbi:MAG TPA: VOC family protein [Candidatus Dormibacteraeota bacterium]|nr:VOC family protein [Candidatus Dormibacteraeota bacterium]